MIVVADTTPINYLVLIGYSSVLRDLFQRVILPRAVFQELQSPPAPDEIRAWCTSMPDWCRVESVKTVPAELMHLGAGEREAIALTEQLRADLLLIAMRRVADVQLVSVGYRSPVRLAYLIRRLLWD